MTSFSDNRPPDDLLDAYQWLVNAAADRYLYEAQRATPEEAVKLTASLRRELTATQTRLVLEQARLRRRAAAKFEHGEKLFFTETGLEQATDEAIARYKARRFPRHAAVADLCCGIGGDLLALAAVLRSVRAVDRDPITALLAAANAKQVGLLARLEERCEAVSPTHVADLDAWHIDPDRRPGGKRTAQPEFSDPDTAAMDAMLAACPNAAIKLAPAADLPPDWDARCQREWISRGGECRQQVAWFGQLADPISTRSAVRISSDGEALARWGPATDLDPPAICQAIGDYVFEPDPAVLAAGLTGSIARGLGLAALATDVVYLTGDEPVASPLLSKFRVIEVLPLDTRRLKSALRARDIGRLEIKKRIVRVDPRELLARLSPRGSAAATLLLSPHGGKQRAILAERVAADE